MEERMLSSSAMLAAAQWEWLMGLGAGRKVASIPQVRDIVLSLSLLNLFLIRMSVLFCRRALVMADTWNAVA